MKVILDYIWLDGNTISDVRYITKIIDVDVRRHEGIGTYFGKTPRLLDQRDDAEKIIPITIDGKITKQETDGDNTITLKPVKLYINPLRVNSYFVICESYDGNNPHKSNSRYSLTESVKELPDVIQEYPIFALKQGFIFYEKLADVKVIYNENTEHLTENLYSSKKTGHEHIVDEFMEYSISMGINITEVSNKFNINSRWEIQTSLNDMLTIADDMLVSRHLLYRLSNKHNVSVSFDKKYFTEVKSEKDEINDPYLLCKKFLKTLTE